MHAIVAHSDTSLTWERVPDPTPQSGEVVIDIAAAGVNRADLLQARGGYPPPSGESEILGLECAGVISAVGDGVAGWSVGDEVCALLAGGGYAEQVSVPATQLLPIPQGVSVADAAALPEAACTVWSNLVMTAGMRAGDTVLIHGGSSGIGSMAIQVARELGARSIVTASTAAKRAACLELGAETAIDYRGEDFVARTLAETDNRGADIILDVVGADYLARNISALADGGRIIVIGLLGGSRTELDLGALMSKRAGVIGTKLRDRPRTGAGSKAEIVADVRRHLWPLLDSGTVKPVIGARMPLPDAGRAHQALAKGEIIGKVVLQRVEGGLQ